MRRAVDKGSGETADDAPPAAIDRLLTRLYLRLGRWYAATFIAAAALSAATGIAIGIVVISSFTGADRDQIVSLIITSLTAGALALAITVLLVFQDFLRWLRWPSAPGEEVAPDAWEATARLPRRAVGIGVVAFSIAYVPVAVLGGREILELDWGTIGPLYLTIEVQIFFSATLDYFALELMLRPVRRDIAAYLPPTFRPAHRSASLGARVLAVVFVVGLTTSVLVASVQSAAETPAARLTVGIVMAVLVVGTVGLIPAYVLAQAELLSRRALIGSARRVQRGDLDAAIPLVAADETAAIAASFNEMLTGLQERERLREHNVELDSALRTSLEEVRASRARIVAAADAERRSVERDLHDGAQQDLVLLRLKLGLLGGHVNGEPGAELLTEVKSVLDRALVELRDLAHGIYPAILESDGLPGALRDAAERAALPVTLDCDGVGRHSAELEAAVYFCCLEALQNAAKHAGPGAHATIRIAEAGEALTFEIADDGAGFDTAAVAGSAGVQNMTDRIGALGGTLRIESTVGVGTTIHGAVPA